MGRWVRRSLRFGVPFLAVAGVALAAGAAAVHRVDQYGRAFMQLKVDIARGDIIEFVNDDPFLHQMYVNAPGFSFDSDEQAPGKVIDVTFPVAGTFDVQCHIHPTMHLTVNVK
jgi:plastocyanin